MGLGAACRLGHHRRAGILVPPPAVVTVTTVTVVVVALTAPRRFPRPRVPTPEPVAPCRCHSVLCVAHSSATVTVAHGRRQDARARGTEHRTLSAPRGLADARAPTRSHAGANRRRRSQGLLSERFAPTDRLRLLAHHARRGIGPTTSGHGPFQGRWVARQAEGHMDLRRSGGPTVGRGVGASLVLPSDTPGLRWGRGDEELFSSFWLLSEVIQKEKRLFRRK